MTCAPARAPSRSRRATSSGAAAVVVEHAHRQQRGVRRDAGDADAVAGRRADDAAHVGAVAVAVLRGVVALDEVAPGHDPAREVGMVEAHAGVDHRDVAPAPVAPSARRRR